MTLTSLFQATKAWARRIKRDSVTLWFAYKSPATPLLAKALCVFVVAYALSPIDLIPDFIPVLGYLDDAILLPGLIWLAIRMLPDAVVDESRIKADAWLEANGRKPTSYFGAVLGGGSVGALALVPAGVAERLGDSSARRIEDAPASRPDDY